MKKLNISRKKFWTITLILILIITIIELSYWLYQSREELKDRNQQFERLIEETE